MARCSAPERRGGGEGKVNWWYDLAHLNWLIMPKTITETFLENYDLAHLNWLIMQKTITETFLENHTAPFKESVRGKMEGNQPLGEICRF
ncbi:hypothetical protein Y032_0102g3475 [Ancylostoma ceylanicum]|uniref:Uncharacterized protein n=1 Tax=Ancylostoma ceylanicum TaxID=53326 RepID=A0A016THE2_9BILA|nr:hypothetical protein Y032_0102g3475 [Ancylostoma ceylanicum]